jgi:hypothetical protein
LAVSPRRLNTIWEVLSHGLGMQHRNKLCCRSFSKKMNFISVRWTKFFEPCGTLDVEWSVSISRKFSNSGDLADSIIGGRHRGRLLFRFFQKEPVVLPSISNHYMSSQDFHKIVPNRTMELNIYLESNMLQSCT